MKERGGEGKRNKQKSEGGEYRRVERDKERSSRYTCKVIL